MTGRHSRRVEIAIDEVVLRGMTAGQARAVVAGIEGALTALATGDLAALAVGPGRHIGVVRPRLSGPPAVDPHDLGGAIARAVWPAVTGRQPVVTGGRNGDRP